MKHLLTIIFFTSLTISAFAQQNCIDCELIDPNAICASIWDPVCGCDGVTYSNDCVAMNSAGVTYWEAGECPSNNVSICSDLSGIDFGACDMVLGIAVVDGECVTVSGCSTTAMNGVDYSSVFTGDQSFCEQNCLCGTANSLDEIERLDIAISPNPMSNEFSLIYRSSKSFEMSITDLTGRNVMDRSIRSEQIIDVSSLKDGVYILVLREKGQLIFSQRIWKGLYGK